MARSHGRLATAIWEGDFRDVTRRAQGTFAFLISQPDLSQAGLIGLRVRRWAKAAKGYTADDVWSDLRELEAARYILIDEEEEEVLVRTFIRNDGVWRQPNVMLKAGEDAREISSPKLRAAFLIELDRLPLDELPDEAKGKAERSPREIVGGVVETVRKAFADRPQYVPDPPKDPSGKGSAKGSDNPSVGVQGTLLARVPHSPTPFPGSVPSERAAASPAAEPSVPVKAARKTDETPPGLVAAAVYDHAGGLVKFISVRQVAEKILARGHSVEQVKAAMIRIYDRGKPITLELVGQTITGRAGSVPSQHPANERFHDAIDNARALDEYDERMAEENHHAALGGTA